MQMDITKFFKPISTTTSSSKPQPIPQSLQAPTSCRTPHAPPSKVPHQPAPHPSLPPQVSIEPCAAGHIPSLKRINALLIPIRYPDKFYTEISSSTETSNLTRVAIWHSVPPASSPRTRKHPPTSDTREGDTASAQAKQPFAPAPPDQGAVIGSIRCRLEHVPCPPDQSPSKEIYIQTLSLLSPYRGLGIATALLDSIIYEAVTEYEATSLYAHVWEKNEDALDWYTKRGFEVKEVLQGYYRRLKPGGAKIVRREIGVGEILRMGRGNVVQQGKDPQGKQYGALGEGGN